jgi:hypothetical protein
MLQKSRAKNIVATEMRDQGDLATLFEQGAAIDLLQYIESTEVGKKLLDGTNECYLWDIERLDRDGEERTAGNEDG